jgi:hypothetical protein
LKRLATYLIALFSTLCVAAQDMQADSVTLTLPTDVYAYYVTVTPGNTFTTMLGHAALRMQCPSAGLDYCFTVKAPEIGNEFTAMTLRTLKAGLVPEETPQFFQDYISEGRGIDEYPLNLTLQEARTLWRLLDEEVARGLYRNVDYIHNGCTQQVAIVLFAALGQRPLRIDSVANTLLPYENRRQILARYMNPSYWKGFVGHSLYGGTPDESVYGRAKLIMPADLAAALRQMELARPATTVAKPTLSTTPPAFSPLMATALFLLLCLIPVRHSVVDKVLLIVYSLFALLLCWIVFVSKTPGTEWNWLLIPFNPLPVLLYKWRGRTFHMLCAVVLLAFLVFMAFNLNRLFFLEQLLVVTGILIRVIYHSFNINLLKQRQV